MEPLVIIVCLVLVGLWMWGGPTSTSEPRVCVCGHDRPQHPEGGACQQEVQKPVAWERDAASGEIVEARWELRTCPCEQYRLPQPAKET